jgi:hypothetical protein
MTTGGYYFYGLCLLLLLLLFDACFKRLRVLLFSLFFILKDLNFALDLALVPDPLDDRVDDDEADVVVDDFLNRLFDGDDGAFVADIFFRFDSE